MNIFKNIMGPGLFLLVFPAFVGADDIPTPPAGGTSLFAPDALSSFNLSGHPTYGERSLAPAEGVPFAQSVELRTQKRPANPWDFQLDQKVSAPVHKGDVLWISLWARATETSTESHEGFSELSVEQSSTPYDKLGTFEFSAQDKWRQLAWACTAPRDYAPGAWQVCLRAGYAPQVLQLGGFQMIDYGTALKPADLPHSKVTYPGMEADAPWRKAAAERIEKYRKADLKVIVKDASGQPVPGATVHIQQLRHAFGFGSCVVARIIEGTGPDSDRYRDIIKNDYSKVVMENDLKWPSWENSAKDGHKTTLAAMQWLHDQGIAIRGHNLVWPSWKNSPGDLVAFKNDPAGLEKHIEEHLQDEVGTIKGQVTDWDVVNEPYANHDLLDLLPPDAMATWFKLVHQIDPKPILFLNDYSGLINRGENTPHKDADEKFVRQLQQQGAPIGGLGIQAHFGGQLTGPEQILKELDRWAALGVDLQVTEFDLNFDDEKLQGQYTRDFMTAVFSHPAVSTLLTWGFWEGSHWIPKAAMYRKDWSIKPNGQAWNDLVLKEWHTDQTATSDASGAVATRGFMGTYQITVTANGKTKSWPVTLSKEGVVLSAVLE